MNNFNPMVWTYVWWNDVKQERDFKEHSTAGEALGNAFDDLESDNPKTPVEIWHKGWIMYNLPAILKLYRKQVDK